MFFIKFDHFDVLKKKVLETLLFQEISNYAPRLAIFRTLVVGLDKLCWHNFEHNTMVRASSVMPAQWSCLGA